MAITTVDGIIAGQMPPYSFLKVGTAPEAAGVLHSHFYATGLPGAAVAPTPGLAGAALTTYAGQLPFTNPVSGNSYLSRWVIGASVVGGFYLVDRLWHNSGFTITTTTAQTVNSVAWPARDKDGSTNGVNVMVGIEVSTVSTNGAVTNTTLQYTNNAGTAGRTGTITSFVAAANVGTFVPFQLQAGDTGVRSVQSLTLGTTYATGVIHLVAYRILSFVPVMIANVPGTVDPVTGGFPRLYDNTVPFIIQQPSATTATTVIGQFIIAQG